jgi:flagellin
VQTAEGALTEVQDMLQRMNELAVKAANGTNSSTDRDAIQDEIDQLTTEIDRVSETTKFNETYLLKGDENGTKDVNFKYKETAVISQDLYYVEDNEVKTLKAGIVTAAVDSTKTYYSTSVGDLAGQKIVAASSASYGAVATVVNGTSEYYLKDSKTGEYYKVNSGTKVDSSETYYTVLPNANAVNDMVAVSSSAVTATGFILSKDIYDSVGNKIESGTNIASASLVSYYASLGKDVIDSTHSVNTANYTANSIVQFVDKEGNEIAANALDKYIDNTGKLDPDAGLYVKSGEGLTDHKVATQSDVDSMVNSSNKFEMGALTLKLHVGADATTNNQISVDIKSMSAKTLGVNGLRVDGDDDTNALNAIETIKAALEKVSDQRSALGAVQNRLEHTINNLDNVVENTTSAESQIRDTDMATEMVRYSNAQVLSQAGQAMLAQANQSNQGVLSLLG